MLEKIGLPAKPSQRGNNWVVDASHCQGCSSQFTFINRKHHCRRCGGLFCNSCTQQRMVLRGQGDSPVRICDPCKKLEEAARFEMRYGHRNRAGRGGSKSTLKSEDEVLNQILGDDRKEAFASSSKSLNAQDVGGGSGVIRSPSTDEFNHLMGEKGTASPEDLRQKALEEKQKYKVLKGEGKPDEALKAFKRGKELERQADALEISLRRSRRNALRSASVGEAQSRDVPGESRSRSKVARLENKEKDDLAGELRELGWSDMDLHNEEKKGKNMTLEGELSSLLGEIADKPKTDKGSNAIDKTQVIALKKKALALKREGKMAEAKEELKKAKILEKQLEEQEFLAEAEDSDDELSELIRSLDGGKKDLSSNLFEQEQGFDFGSLLSAAGDQIIDGNFDATEDDMEDPEIAAALKSLGWTEDSDNPESIVTQIVSEDKESLSKEILSLKREAVRQKRAGNISEAMALLKKEKLLERDLEVFESHEGQVAIDAANSVHSDSTSLIQPSPRVAVRAKRSKGEIQRELLNLKRKALSLRRKGETEEADEVLKMAKVLEVEMEELEAPKQVRLDEAFKEDKPDSFESLIYQEKHENPADDAGISGGKSQATSSTASKLNEPSSDDMEDPEIAAALKSLGWTEDSDNPENTVTQVVSADKESLSKEILSLKREAVSQKRAGNISEAMALLKKEKLLERDLEGFESHDRKVAIDAANSVQSDSTSLIRPSPPIDVRAKRSKGEIQRELLNLKRKALALRRKGETEEAEEVLKMAKVLEAEMEELEAPKQVHLNEAFKEDKPDRFGSLINQEKHENPIGDAGISGELSQATQSTASKLIEPSSDIGSMGSDTARHALLRNSDISNPLNSRLIGDQMSAEKQEDMVLGDEKPRVHESNTVEEHPFVARKDDIKMEKRENMVLSGEKQHVHEANSSGENASQNNESSLKQDILTRKRKAVALKREGKLAEAREELRQAKLLEKSLEKDDVKSKISPAKESVSTSNVSPVGQKERRSSNTPPKPISSRDRFKLQQESLAHKRQALKLRREGRSEEAEAEFELAKALETQLEELSAQDSSGVEPENDVGVEDFLDPQLLSALRAIGIDNTNIAPRIPDRPSSKPNVGKIESANQERTKLEEQIKAEKVKALNLKRSGRQAEALDALRTAKLLEKKMNSLS